MNKLTARLSAKWFATVTMALLLSACGFQLKGLIELDESLRQATINTPPNSNFQVVKPLERSLEANGVQLVGQISANYQINILQELQERRTSTISSSNGIDEYELKTTVTFVILDRNNEIVVPEQTLDLERTYSYNPNQQTASDAEEAILRTEMSERLASQILRVYSFIKTPQ